MHEMKTALLANEVGRGFGHVKRLASLALRLRLMGWRVVLATFRLSFVDRNAAPFDDVVPAPGWPGLQQETWFHSGLDKAQPANSFAPVIAQLGMADSSVIANITQAWESLFRFISPAVVIGDFAPGAMLAASGRFPTFAVGTGFTVPAIKDGRFVLFRDRYPCDAPLQSLICEAVEEAMKNAGRAQLCDPLLAIRGEHPLPVCYRSLDVARGRRLEDVLPPEIATAAPSIGKPSFVGAYFGPDLGPYAPLLRAIGCVKPRPVLALPERTRSLHKETVAASQLTVRNSLFTAEDLARDCMMFIHHGGLGVTQLCAAAGIPQLIIFHDTEKWLNGEAVMEQGAGIAMPLHLADEAAISKAAGALLKQEQFKSAANTWRTKLALEDKGVPSSEKICNKINAFVA
jgi:hypothetical protein